MSETIESLVTRVGEWITVDELDLQGLQARLHRRRRRQRRQRTGVALALAAVLAVAGVVVVDQRQTAPQITTTTPSPLRWRQESGTPDADVFGLVHGTNGVVAVGANHGGPAAAGIWYAPDGGPWQLVYSQSEQFTFSVSTMTLFNHVVATPSGYVVTGSIQTSGAEGGVTKAAAWTSTDGTTWQPVDTSAFGAAAAGGPRDQGPLSAIYDLVTVQHATHAGLALPVGSVLGVGELYTNSKAPDGGQPCIWISTDGTHWTHILVNAGSGFDPVLTKVAVRDGVVIASGAIDRDRATTWSTRDLHIWTPTTLSAHGNVEALIATDRGFVAAGVTHISTGSGLGGTPTIWTSQDGTNWTQVLQLQPAPITDFVGLATTGTTTLAVGRRQPHSSLFNTGFAYVTNDGHTWTRTDRPPVFPTRSLFSAVATTTDGFIIAGTTPTTSTASAVWRSAG